MPTMKAYASFDLYLADQSPANQKIVRALRAFVKRTSPELVEAVKWGNGCWLNGRVPAAYVYCDKDFVQFGFIRGSELEDPQGLLEGNGQYVRHVKVRQPSDIEPKAFGALLRQAARYDTMPTPGKKAATGAKKSAKAGTKTAVGSGRKTKKPAAVSSKKRRGARSG
jgi:hypothetical protein